MKSREGQRREKRRGGAERRSGGRGWERGKTERGRRERGMGAGMGEKGGRGRRGGGSKTLMLQSLTYLEGHQRRIEVPGGGCAAHVG